MISVFLSAFSKNFKLIKFMIKKLLFLVSILPLFLAKAQVVDIPDIHFKTYLITSSAINTNNDNEIQVSEAVAFTGTINSSNLNIKSLKGIEAFINLSALRCFGNQLETLDVSQNIVLDELNCGQNKLTSLDVSKNTKLTKLDCSTNQLIHLDVSKNLALKSLSCYLNQFSTLDVSKNVSLDTLYCYENSLFNIDVSKNTALEYFDISFNKLTSIDVSKNSNLLYLKCAGNTLANLNVSQNPYLSVLEFYDNFITDIDISKNVELTYFQGGNNRLSSLDVTKNINLWALDCYGNKLTTLDVSKNPNLGWLLCYDNKLTSLDVSKNTMLSSLDCSTNLLQTLNVKNGHNSNVYNFSTIDNPLLACIQVDDVNYSNTNWKKKDVIASYNTNCNDALAVSGFEQNNIKIYPNPVKDILNFSEEVSDIKILDISGKLMTQNPISTKFVNVTNLPKGIYIITAKTKSNNIINQKLIKE